MKIIGKWWVGIFCVVGMISCDPDPGLMFPGDVGTSAGSGGNSTATGTPEDQTCQGRSDGTPVCSSAGEPSQCFNGHAVPQQPACSNQLAFCANGHCTCKAGEDIRCVPSPDGGVTAELCSTTVNSYNEYQSFQVCKPDQTCVPGKKSANAGCVTVTTPCSGDFYTCDTDGNTVLHCQKDSNGFYHWIPTLNCREAGFANGCFAVPASNAQGLCKNACNVLGVPLNGDLCSSSGTPLFCAVNVCSADGKALVPDHKDCRSPGQPCSAPELCKSCSCISGQCAGSDTIGLCPPAKMALCTTP